MQAIGLVKSASGPDAGKLIDCDVPEPTPGPQDIVVEVRGMSVNPVDTKMRARLPVSADPHVLGYDASGEVVAVGGSVTAFKPGDAVFYAGDMTRPGSNARYQAVDARIVGRKPASLDDDEAAALPLTAITAWEMLFDSFKLKEGGGAHESLLVVGGAGGVGSILIQLAKRLTSLEVIATASRPETVAWVEAMGADHVVNHANPLDAEVAALGKSPAYIAALTHTDAHLPAMVEMIRPRGHIGVIDDPKTLDILPFKRKAVSISWEFMFARPVFEMPDIQVQGDLLNRVADLVDAKELRSTAQQRLGPVNAAAMQRAHDDQLSASTIGKSVFGAVG